MPVHKPEAHGGRAGTQTRGTEWTDRYSDQRYGVDGWVHQQNPSQDQKQNIQNFSISSLVANWYSTQPTQATNKAEQHGLDSNTEPGQRGHCKLEGKAFWPAQDYKPSLGQRALGGRHLSIP